MASQSRPYQPGDEERDRYYYGFSGNPRLVARTSSNRWSKPMHKRGWSGKSVQTSKKYAPIVDHILASTWTRDLSFAIINILERCAWSYFFPIRIGLEETPDRESPKPEFSTILLVAVEEDSLQWNDGIAIALQCRDALREFKIFDVEVEIRESRYQRHGASTSFEAHIDPMFWDTPTNQAVLPMLSFLGYPIAYLKDQPGGGSVGLHLKLGDDERAVYALTCRHIVENDRDPHTIYSLSEAEQHFEYYAQANNCDFDDCLQSLESIREDLKAGIRPLAERKTRWIEWYSHDENTNHRPPTKEEMDALQNYQIQIDYNNTILELFKAIDRKTKRKIGHLAFLPTSTVSSQQPGYFKDWALVLLDNSKFINEPENKVFIGAEHPYRLKPWLDNGFLTLRLQDEDEIEHGNAFTVGNTFTVGKRGVKTGLTFGTKSSIEAVIRHTSKGRDVHAWEMLIVPHGNRFSDKGDSGSSVFDLEGHVVGLVTGSTDSKPEDWRGFPKQSSPKPLKLKTYPGGTVGPEEADETPNRDLDSWSNGTDITFATPIQWVLKDIRDFTGLQPRLA